MTPSVLGHIAELAAIAFGVLLGGVALSGAIVGTAITLWRS